MSKPHLSLLIPTACLSVVIACGSNNLPGNAVIGNTAGSSGAIGSSGAVGSSGATGSSGAAAQAGASGATGVGGSAGFTNSAGTGGVGGSDSSGGGAAGAATGGTSAAGGGGMPAAAGASGAAGSSGMHVRIGKSVGCSKVPPGNDSSSQFVLHEVHMTGLDPIYLKGGMYYDPSGPYDASFRPYSVRLPTGYDPSKPYTVTFGGGGCGGNASSFAGNPGGGLQIDKTGSTIQVGLSYLTGCFSDGGPSIGNRTDTPEEPYFRAIMKDIEANYCIDLSRVFLAGFSSGGWESYTLGCAAADLIRGTGAEEGGLRTMHPPCKGPVSAVMVAGEADTINPIGPLAPTDPKVLSLGSLGSAPGRDDILKRNGCVGTATVPFSDPMYPACVSYSGCPAAYPVIWCPLPGAGHNNSSYNGTNYSPGPMWEVLNKLPTP